jgi:hypothetical protein
MPERGVVYSVGRDTTERRRADAELREAQRLLEASRDELRGLAEEQAALRRVATLVAQGASPSAVLDAVAAEMERALGADGVTLLPLRAGRRGDSGRATPSEPACTAAGDALQP